LTDIQRAPNYRLKTAPRPDTGTVRRENEGIFLSLGAIGEWPRRAFAHSAAVRPFLWRLDAAMFWRDSGIVDANAPT